MSDLPKRPRAYLYRYDDIELLIQYIRDWETFAEKMVVELEKLIQESPIYPDDVGGMYPYEIQMYSADVDNFVKKVKEVLEALQ